MRSLLFVPADSDRKLAKSTGAGADALILDLEDSVLPERKLAARGLAREFLGSAVPGVQIWVRVNDLASGELLKDLTAILPAKPAGIVLPKIRGPEDIQTVSNYLEQSTGVSASATSIMALATETPIAVLRLGELVRHRLPRLAALSWGAEDLSSALGAGDPRYADGSWRPLYAHARAQCILAAHALGVEAIDTVYLDYRDTTGLGIACHASRHDGFTGCLAIHPDQVAVINAAFTPSDAEIALAHRIVQAFAGGEGAVSIDGRMFDVPHLKAAQRLIRSCSAR
jgi:citrate lyase subunit beta/citryl-CoA lyase